MDASSSPAYSRAFPRAITTREIAEYQEGGAAVIRGVLSLAWVERMGRAVDRILANPGSASIEYTPKEKKGRYYGDFPEGSFDFQDGDRMINAAFPQVWPRS
jgi:hypothetical protein